MQLVYIVRCLDTGNIYGVYGSELAAKRIAERLGADRYAYGPWSVREG